MANTDYKSTDALMRHLRDNGIAIAGSAQISRRNSKQHANRSGEVSPTVTAANTRIAGRWILAPITLG